MTLRLHIGGQHPHPDWKILDIEARPEVDFVGNAAHLYQFSDNSITAIYASHVLEHFHHRLHNELARTLREWHRVLIPGGQLMISVPNLRTLCWLYLLPELPASGRYQLMQIMYGAQSNEHDVHHVGFDLDILIHFLGEAGFQEFTPVDEFGLFQDFSSLRIHSTLISLNGIALK